GASARPPAHPIQGRARARVGIKPGDRETVLLIETNRARVVLIDQQIKTRWRNALGGVDQGDGDIGAPGFRGDDDLIEIARRIDGDETGERTVKFRDRDLGAW